MRKLRKAMDLTRKLSRRKSEWTTEERLKWHESQEFINKYLRDKQQQSPDGSKDDTRSEVSISCHSIFNDARRFARIPFGGSLVNLTPFRKIATGKSFDGYDVNHKRKLSCVICGSIFSTMASNFDIQLGNKWQFCKTTQLPSITASLINRSATGPWP